MKVNVYLLFLRRSHLIAILPLEKPPVDILAEGNWVNVTMVTLHRATGAVANALSFSRSAMRELVRGRWRIEKDRIELDVEGRGEILYRLVGHGWLFSHLKQAS